MPIDVKICGLSTASAVSAAVAGGAHYVGFVFFPPSPRAIGYAQAKELASMVPASVARVGLFVDPTDDELSVAVECAMLDMVQLHGEETPERVRAVRAFTRLPVIKAIAVEMPQDVDRTKGYEGVADRLLFDARAPKSATRPGGNALSFDWALLRERKWLCPWFVAGGLNADNLVDAVKASGATAVDVSSGVEDSPGHKNTEKIRRFLDLASTL